MALPDFLSRSHPPKPLYIPRDEAHLSSILMTALSSAAASGSSVDAKRLEVGAVAVRVHDEDFWVAYAAAADADAWFQRQLADVQAQRASMYSLLRGRLALGERLVAPEGLRQSLLETGLPLQRSGRGTLWCP